MKKPLPLLILILAVSLMALLKFVSFFFVRWSWFAQLGLSVLYLRPLLAGIGLFSLLAILHYGFWRLSLQHALRVYENARDDHFFGQSPLDQIRDMKDGAPTSLEFLRKPANLVLIPLSMLAALAGARSGWMTVFEFIHRQPFGVTEGVFGMDVSFYLYQIPFLEWILRTLAGALVPVLILSLAFYLLSGLIRFVPGQRQKIFMFPKIRNWLGSLLAATFLLLASHQLLSLFEILYSQRGYVFGAGFTDLRLAVPLGILLAIVSLLGVVLCLAYRKKQKTLFLLIPLAAYLGLSILGGITMTFVQYTVSNNEFNRERPYILREMEMTRKAYNLHTVQSREYDGTTPLNYTDMLRNEATIENIRLNDPAALQEVISQQQGLRYYYRFNDIDVDRYEIDGAQREILLSAREISQTALTERAGTFINLTMRYTHGFGAVATLANAIDQSGYAELLLRDMPPVTDHPALDITQPRIYFGELTNDDQYGYVITGSRTGEFDYPFGDMNMEYRYTGADGFSFTPLNRLMLSLHYNTLRFYITREIEPASRLLMIRNIQQRVETLTPFLAFDADPYLVIREDGRLNWIMDGYTVKNRFPYARPYGEFNYIRNSVKVVVDAYDGTVTYYIFDDSDPVIATYSAIFPGVFQPGSSMPDDLRRHVRYPEDYFLVQSRMLLSYHMEDPSVFYNQEDTWNIARKAMAGGTTGEVDPYYNVMALPDQPDRSNTEFLLILPFTPTSRQDQPRNNLVGWLAARSDGEHYGELILYRLPKTVEIQGPLMIDTLIDQDPTISGQLSLWDRSGSRVIRGNLLTIPMDGGFIYVEPIYLKAEREGSSIPQMQAVVFATGRDLVLVETNQLDEAIRVFFQEELAIPDDPEDREIILISPDRDELLQLIRELRQTLDALEETVRSEQPDTPALP